MLKLSQENLIYPKSGQNLVKRYNKFNDFGQRSDLFGSQTR